MHAAASDKEIIYNNGENKIVVWKRGGEREQSIQVGKVCKKCDLFSIAFLSGRNNQRLSALDKQDLFL